MGLKAFKERLKEIKMSEYDAKLYNEFSSSVQNQVGFTSALIHLHPFIYFFILSATNASHVLCSQVQALRVILGNLQAKSKERQWMRHQTSGELDDTKLIEGLPNLYSLIM